MTDHDLPEEVERGFVLPTVAGLERLGRGFV
jgi:hypothetical protein